MRDIDWCTQCADAACLLSGSKFEGQRMFAYIVVRCMKDALSLKDGHYWYDIVANGNAAIMTISSHFYNDVIGVLDFMKDCWHDEEYWKFMEVMLADAMDYDKYESVIIIKDDGTVSIQIKRC